MDLLMILLQSCAVDGSSLELSIHSLGRIYSPGSINSPGSIYSPGTILSLGRIHSLGRIYSPGRIHAPGWIHSLGRINEVMVYKVYSTVKLTEHTGRELSSALGRIHSLGIGSIL